MRITVEMTDQDRAPIEYEAPIVTYVSDEGHDLYITCETAEGERMSAALFNSPNWVMVNEVAPAKGDLAAVWQRKQAKAEG